MLHRPLPLLALLVGCQSAGPTVIAETAKTISASEGGTLELDDVTLEIPAGALPEDVEITLSVLEASDDYPAMEGMSGPIYSLEPDGIQFEVPVQLSLPMPEGVSAEGSYMVLWDEEAGWETSEYQVREEGEIIAMLSHFSVRSIWSPERYQEFEDIRTGLCLEHELGSSIQNNQTPGDAACQSLGCTPAGSFSIPRSSIDGYHIPYELYRFLESCAPGQWLYQAMCRACPEGLTPDDFGYAMASELVELGHDACPDNDDLELPDEVCGCSDTFVPVEVDGEMVCDECPDNDDLEAPHADCGCDAYAVDEVMVCGEGCAEGFVLDGVQQFTPAEDNPRSCPDPQRSFFNTLLDHDDVTCATVEEGDGDLETCSLSQSCVIDPVGGYYEEVRFEGATAEHGFVGRVTQRFWSEDGVIEGSECSWEVSTEEPEVPQEFTGDELGQLSNASFLEHSQAFVHYWSITADQQGPNTADVSAASEFMGDGSRTWSGDVTYSFEAPYTFHFVDSSGPFTFSCAYCERGSDIRDCDDLGFEISQSFYGHGLICDMSTTGELFAEGYRGDVKFFR